MSTGSFMTFHLLSRLSMCEPFEESHSASDIFNLLEVYRGEEKGADDVDEGATDPTEET